LIILFPWLAFSAVPRSKFSISYRDTAAEDGWCSAFAAWLDEATIGIETAARIHLASSGLSWFFDRPKRDRRDSETLHPDGLIDPASDVLHVVPPS
jgi:hypothetical protein